MDIVHSTKFILDSGDLSEYRKIKDLAEKNDAQLWGATTNPSLIAKAAGLTEKGKKFTQKEAFDFQKETILEIVKIVPGAVSAEVYADLTTKAEEMVKQGREIATWHQRVVVKLPTTLEGLKARTTLRKEKINTNNTLVFSQQQIFAICLHEHIMQKKYGPIDDLWPPFISPFVGRLDDIGEDGMDLVENGMKIKKLFSHTLPASPLAIWMLEASVRKVEHIRRGILAHTELITAPASALEQWFALTQDEKDQIDSTVYAKDLQKIPYWTPDDNLLKIDNEEDFYQAIEAQKIDITHPLTEKGIVRFVEDWKTILK
jgi:transaldolase